MREELRAVEKFKKDMRAQRECAIDEAREEGREETRRETGAEESFVCKITELSKKEVAEIAREVKS